MSDFPDSLFTPREVDNREGVEYDAEKTKVFFAEDHNKATAEIVAIQEALGVGKVNMALDGWIPAGETWTYASATTFTITGDKTDKYQKGDKIKLTQTTAKYFSIIGVVYSSPNTTITVTAGSDYSLANATITSPNYSKQENPQGFPAWFNWTPSYSANGSMTYTSVTTTVSRFKIIGETVFINLMSSGTTGGTANTNLEVTPPITPAYDSGSACYLYDAGSLCGIVNFRTTNIIRFQRYDNSNYNLGVNKFIRANCFYSY